MKAGFIGLGHLGRAMAKRLMEEGVTLVAWNRTREKAEALGCGVAATPAELAEREDVIILNLFDSSAVMDVINGPGGLMEADLTGKVIVDTTTNHYSPAEGFHSAVAAKGAEYVEAPVLGSIVPASRGKLTVVASAGDDAFRRALPFLEKIGANIFHLGDKPGLASRMKLVNNLLLGTFMTSIAEALSIGEAAGVEKETVLEILEKGGGESLVLRAKKEKLLKEDYSPHFKTELIYKDLHFLQDLARDLKHPLFTGAVAKELFGLAASKGDDKEDFSVVYRAVKKG